MVSSMVGMLTNTSVPATEPAGKVTVVSNLLKSEPSTALLGVPPCSSTVKSTVYESSIPTYCWPPEPVPVDKVNPYCMVSPSVLSWSLPIICAISVSIMVPIPVGSVIVALFVGSLMVTVNCCWVASTQSSSIAATVKVLLVINDGMVIWVVVTE